VQPVFHRGFWPAFYLPSGANSHGSPLGHRRKQIRLSSAALFCIFRISDETRICLDKKIDESVAKDTVVEINPFLSVYFLLS